MIREGRSPEIQELIKNVEDWQLSLMTPKNFDNNDVDNYIRRIELSFEALCASIEDLGVARPGELTIFQFYNKLLYFEKKKQNKPRR